MCIKEGLEEDTSSHRDLKPCHHQMHVSLLLCMQEEALLIALIARLCSGSCMCFRFLIDLSPQAMEHILALKGLYEC